MKTEALIPIMADLQELTALVQQLVVLVASHADSIQS